MSSSRRRTSKPLIPWVFVGLALATTTGCSLHRANLSPAPLKGGQAYPVGEAPSTPVPPWWSNFESAGLDLLIRRALEENLDATASRERINQSIAVYQQGRAGLFPTLEVEGDITDEVFARGRTRKETQWSAGANARWVPDLFGRQSSIAKARAADTWVRIYETENFRLALSASVADVYFNIIEQRWLLTLLEEQRGTAKELLHIIGQRYEEGLISNLDVLQQQSQVAELESQIPVAKATLEDLQNALGALLGATPGDPFVTTVGEGAQLPVIGPLARLERIDELLLRRPDLKASRASLVAADAETGRALADRLPKLTLTAEALYVEGRSPATTVVSLGGGLVQPLLDWGLRRQEWVRTKAVYRERLATFSQDFLQAAWEMEALVRNESRQRELLEALANRRIILESTIKQARSRYDAGLTDYLPVLSTTQQLYSVEQRSIRENRRLTTLRISLHRAMGGPVTRDPAQPAFAALVPKS